MCYQIESLGPEDRIFSDTISTDALAPCVTKSLAAMVLSMAYKQVLAFHKERFQLTPA